jgi:hypothetical protein
MSSRVDTISIDCADPRLLAAFWAAALGYQIKDEWDDGPDDQGARIDDPSNPRMRVLFQKIPDTKTVKNRIHFDLRPSRTRDEEVERLKRLGAIELEGFGGPEATWKVLQDPEATSSASSGDRRIPFPRAPNPWSTEAVG